MVDKADRAAAVMEFWVMELDKATASWGAPCEGKRVL